MNQCICTNVIPDDDPACPECTAESFTTTAPAPLHTYQWYLDLPPFYGLARAMDTRYYMHECHDLDNASEQAQGQQLTQLLWGLVDLFIY